MENHMPDISFRVIGWSTAVMAAVACSSGGDDSTPPGNKSDSGAAEAATDAPPLSPDCKRLYDCCVGPAGQSPAFCTGLVGQGICDVWLQSYAQAGIQCQ
jgi:hypothetical protein